MGVFVTCFAGVGRSSALVLAHLLVGPLHGRTTEEALDFLSARHPAANPSRLQIEAAVEAARAYPS